MRKFGIPVWEKNKFNPTTTLDPEADAQALLFSARQEPYNLEWLDKWIEYAGESHWCCKKRLSDAIHLLQANKNKIELISSSKTSKGGKLRGGKNNKNIKNEEKKSVVRTIISAEEEKAFDLIQERYRDILQSISYINESIDLLKKNHGKCKLEVNRAFDEIIVKLNNRRQQLLERLNFEGNKK